MLPHLERIEQKDFPLLRQLLEKAGEVGLLSIDVPEKYGGMELDTVSSVLVAEHISKNGSFGASFGAHSGIGTSPIVFFGTEAQKAKYLPRLARAELIGAYALSEAHAGSDALAARCRAELSPDGNSYVLNGEKMWITNGGFADLFTVFAKVDGEKFTAFLVEKSFSGVTPGPEEKEDGDSWQLDHAPDSHRLPGADRERTPRGGPRTCGGLQHSEHRPAEAGRSLCGRLEDPSAARRPLCQPAPGLRKSPSPNSG